MSKRFWNRNQRSVSLPRSELVEINPMVPGRSRAAEGAAAPSSSGPRMTVETLFPTTSSPGNGFPKLAGRPTFGRTPKQGSTFKNWPKMPGSLLPTKSVGTLNKSSNKENLHHRKPGSRHLAATPSRRPPQMDELAHDWRKSFQVAVSARENRSSPQLTSTQVASTSSIVISSDDDDYPDSKLANLGKRIHKLTGKAPKKAAKDHKAGKVAPPRSLGTKIKATSQVTDPRRSKVGAGDFVYHENLNDKIAVTTVMPQFYALWDSSHSPDGQPSTSKFNPPQHSKSLPTSDADFLFVEDLENRRAVENLMPELLTPPKASSFRPLEGNPPTRDLSSLMGDDDHFPLSISAGGSSKRDPLWGSTCIRKEQHWDGAWRKNDLCESAMREIPLPAAPPESVESWRAVESICMRMRGLDVPDNQGLVEEAPSFDELLDVLGVWEQEAKQEAKN
ncbi:uncharacterized protein LOC120446831 [Drosophila santomea]|uniref:uncharacterized protein LOC120446831 n=1 Tax=Drosophila santomea TaxID=129105 RepID=UPI00195308B9|nr:uncharacterized protein LOC120446831 [Drosophila santomea]XP_039483949.1 uncharacterized protein LOC120446831 [Drosophila santomea]